jgi:hypothetical protein
MMEGLALKPETPGSVEVLLYLRHVFGVVPCARSEGSLFRRVTVVLEPRKEKACANIKAVSQAVAATPPGVISRSHIQRLLILFLLVEGAWNELPGCTSSACGGCIKICCLCRLSAQFCTKALSMSAPSQNVG